MDTEEEFDFFVIGGGSGGLAAVKAAQDLGAKCGIADYVKPSPIGTKWGLGGTCVNVGCIPKKMMHFAANLGEYRDDQKAAGWSIGDDTQHEWTKMVKKVQNHIKSLNFGYKSQLLTKEIKYFNRLAKLLDANTIELVDPKNNNSERIRAKKILIAVGGRPSFPDEIPDVRQLCITSDDLFSLKENPGKTLVVGASYVALECAGFLAGFGNDVSVLVRSILLRGFDQDIAEKIGEYMSEHKCKFIRGFVPIKIEKLESGRKKVTWKNPDTNETGEDEFDTVLLAIGRTADTDGLNLASVGVKTDSKNKKIIVNDLEETSIPNIFAIGDNAVGRPELTPTAIMAGILLAKRLFGGSSVKMDYRNVATTVFTPIEYGCVGYSEEAAEKEFGKERIIVYHRYFKPLEWNYFEEHSGEACYIKIVCDKERDRKILGLHYLGPNAGEVIQGYSVAIKIGVTKEQFDSTVGIHPTTAEELLGIEAIKGIDDGKKEGC